MPSVCATIQDEEAKARAPSMPTSLEKGRIAG